MRALFLIKEALVNIRRNALVVLGAVLAVFVTLVLAFGSLVVAELVRVNTQRWEDGVRLIGFVNDELSPSGVNALIREVEGWDGVDEVTFVSKAEAYDEALGMFEEGSLVRRTIEENPTVVPASIRIKPADSEEYQLLENRMAATPGIIDVTSPGAALDVMLGIRSFLTQLSLVVVIGLAVSAVVLIANTIRLAIYARRDQVGIMKLVGASNWFVRIPFLLEGMIEGLIGGLLAVGLVAGLHALVLEQGVDRFPDLFRFEVATDFIYSRGAILLAFGILVGVLGSGIALRRFLREA